MIDEITESAKAVKSIADVGKEGLTTARSFGTLVERYFGPISNDIIGIFHDKIRYRRMTQALKLMEKARNKMHEKGIESVAPVSLKFALPFFEAASLEENEEIQEMWASLLVNAIDPNYEGTIGRTFVTILQDFEPLDAIIFQEIARDVISNAREWQRSEISKNVLVERLEKNSEDAETSLDNLGRLGLIDKLAVPGDSFQEPGTFYKGKGRFRLTLLGRQFYLSCVDHPGSKSTNKSCAEL